jgi:SAM-dependent MidA family methyltransferase
VTELPEPGAAARAHSERVAAHLRAAIAGSGGYIPFSRYMELALYAPGLGYYAAGATKLGAAGDFVTAPEMTPLFAQALATQVAAIIEVTQRREIVELGGGSGRLAADLLAALEARDALPLRYTILEPSPDLACRQRETLARDAPSHLERVAWVGALPASIDGALIANEVLDAVPATIVSRRGGEWLERGVEWDAARGAFAWAERPAAARLAAMAAARFPPQGDYTSEFSPPAEALVGAACRRVTGGAALWIDYGFPAAEYYHPQRSEGTLMCHYRHRAHDDPFFLPGLQDITTHVDFSAIAQAGREAGLDLLGYATQAQFLVSCGITDLLAQTPAEDVATYAPLAAQAQKLLSPAEMGEFFKVIALGKGVSAPLCGFELVDRSHTL